MNGEMDLGWAIFWTVVVLLFWPAVLGLGDLIDRAFQRRMEATLWRSLPHEPTPDHLKTPE